MPNYLDSKNDRTSNFSRESRINTTNISLFDKYESLIKMNPVWYEQISRFKEVLGKIELMNNDEIHYIIIFTMDLAHKRRMI
jgi:hypothetical protein